jgi:hypothetical protein
LHAIISWKAEGKLKTSKIENKMLDSKLAPVPVPVHGQLWLDSKQNFSNHFYDKSFIN